jgi:hypothetical protein
MEDIPTSGNRMSREAAVRRESFERFYLTKIALGEGCGCAEHATRIRELESYAERRTGKIATPRIGARLSNLARRLIAPFRHEAATNGEAPTNPCP